jgi:23S rRNA (cytidine1920-2'-O)/16S rRNA (cytidine1409-2'-O)-methyltransferase
MSKKERLDNLAVERGLFTSREQAKRSIMAGLVTVSGELADKPGMQVDNAVIIEIKAELHPYVSRGGLKLAKAIEVFDLSLTDRIMIDIGASTGGFTDCALQNGASEVYAIDVGYGQLAWKLRQDERVHVMERTNFRHVQPSDFVYGKPDFVVIDVSFISLRIILENLLKILEKPSEIVALVKPQFEAGREKVGKKGVISDPKTHLEVLEKIIDFAVSSGYKLAGLDYSPIRGAEGNIEFLLYLKSDIGGQTESIVDLSSDIKGIIEGVVTRAHTEGN